MTDPVGSTPEDRTGTRQLATAARLLELVATRYGRPGYEALAAEFERTHRSADVISGLIVIAGYFGELAAGDQYLRVLAGWQLLGQIADLDPQVDSAS